MNIDQSKPIFIKFSFPELAEAMARQLESNGYTIDDSEDGYTGICVLDDILYLHSRPCPKVDYQVIDGCQHWPELRELEPVSKEEWHIEDTILGKTICNQSTDQHIISFIHDISEGQAETICNALNRK